MIVGPSVDVPESRCPYCKIKLDAAFEIGDNGKPSPGSVSLCIHCGEWAVFDRNLELIKPSSKILAGIKGDRKCQIAYHATMKLIRKRSRQN